jgi:hypothetical protein
MRCDLFAFPYTLQNITDARREQMLGHKIHFVKPEVYRGVEHKKCDCLSIHNDFFIVLVTQRYAFIRLEVFVVHISICLGGYSTILAGLLTVVLSLFALMMVWRCWNSPPVPLIRLWALAWSGMSLWMLYFFWRAEAWKTKAEKLELKLQEQRRLKKRQVLSSAGFLYADDRTSFLSSEIEFPALITQYDFHRELLARDPSKRATGWTNNIRNVLSWK